MDSWVTFCQKIHVNTSWVTFSQNIHVNTSGVQLMLSWAPLNKRDIMKYSTEAYNLTSLCAVSCGISSLHWYRSRVCKPLYNYRKIYLKPNWCPLNLPGLEKVIAIFHLYTCRRLTNHFPCSIFISNQPSLPCSPPLQVSASFHCSTSQCMYQKCPVAERH